MQCLRKGLEDALRAENDSMALINSLIKTLIKPRKLQSNFEIQNAAEVSRSGALTKGLKNDAMVVVLIALP